MMFNELGVRVTQPTIIREDNKVFHFIADYAGNLGRTKHIKALYHFVREGIQQGNTRVDYIPTSKNVADKFTKALPRESFFKF